VLDAQPLTAGRDGILKLLMTASEGGFEVGGCTQLLGDLR
jgi:hypothetical protein